MLIDRSQRWRDRRDIFVPGSSIFNASAHSVDVIASQATISSFIAAHHYAATTPPVRLAAGLFANGKGGRSELVGVCVFSVPINNASVPKTAGLSDPLAACDLGRLCLLDSVGSNGESFLVSRAMRLLRQEKPEIISVMSYADPIRRHNADGKLILPGHVGQLYATMNAMYFGRSSPRTDLLLPDGTILSPRTKSKLRNEEQGYVGALNRLLKLGARQPDPGEELKDWLSALENEGFFSRRRHPGNHTYVFPLTRAARHAARQKPTLPYPVLDRARREGDVTALPLLSIAA